MKTMFAKLQEETQRRIQLGSQVDPDLNYMLKGMSFTKTQKKVLEHQAKTFYRFKDDAKAKLFY